MTGPVVEGQVQVRKKYPGPGPDRTSDSLKAAAFLLDGFSFFYENPKSIVSIFLLLRRKT